MKWEIPISEGGAVNLVGRSGEVEIEVIANMNRQGNRIILDKAHFTKNAGDKLLPNQLQEFGRDFLRQHGNGATELVIQGATRTTGAAPGKVPPPITIKLE
jgi:hypothetical protein